MKNSLKCLLSLALAILSLSCVPDKEPVTPTHDGNPSTPSTPATGAITPVGMPEGTAQSATIGPAGGTIASADQRLQIMIPAGALTENKTISVQPLTNNCPSGTRQAFRLTPHGLTFAKPAIITFQFDEHDVNGSAPEFLRVAYQTEKGSWQSPTVKSIDTIAHTVAVQTMHFSDWSLFQNVILTPSSAILDPGGKVNLYVQMCIETNSTNDDEDLFVPIPSFLDEKYIESWQVAAEGSLNNGKSSNTNTYQAPNHIPAKNPVAITVFLNKSEIIDGKVYRNLRLVSNVFVAQEGISVQVDGGGWQTFPGGANMTSTQHVVTGKSGAETASVTWKGAPTGTFRWTKSTDVAFNLLKGPMIYQHIYGKGIVSGGSLVVDNTNPTWVVGTFTLQPAGWIRPSTPPDVMGTAHIKGVFRMKRVGSN